MNPLETRLVDQLTAALDAFIEAWESGQRPDVAAFVPETADASLRHHAQIELIKIDLEYGWGRGQGDLLDAYMTVFPGLVRDGAPPAALIHEEFVQRRRAGDRVSAASYLDRYPTRASELETLLALEGDEDAAPPTVSVGDTLDDFMLVELLGEGAFAQVFLARQQSMHRMVALKVSVDRGDEAQTLAQFDHPYIVRVFDQRRLPERDLRLLYMEYVPAGSLRAVVDARAQLDAGAAPTGRLLLDVVDAALRDRGEVPPSDSKHRDAVHDASWADAVCLLGAQIGDALDYAHTRGVQHRDIKPANVLLDRTGAAKLADFNVSQRHDAADLQEIGGSLAYMAPEHLRASSPVHAGTLDERADIFSLGVLLYELLTGGRPFSDEGIDPTDPQATFDALIASRSAGLGHDTRAQAVGDGHGMVVAAIERALAPDPTQRYTRAADFARALDLCRMPRAAHLVTPPPSSRLHLIRRNARWALLAAALLPNLVLSALNTLYNLGVVVRDPDNAAFFRMVAAVNITAFTIGIGVVYTWIRRLAHGVEQVRDGATMDAPAREARRLALLRYPSRLMWVVFPLWVMSGLAFPIWLSFRHRAEPSVWLNFTGSNILFGVLASTICYFLAHRISLRALYPAFVVAGEGTSADAAAAAAVRERASRTLAVLTAVPFISLVALALLDIRDRTPLLVLGIVGSLSFAFAYRAMRFIRSDMRALREVLMLRPAQR